MNISGMKKTSEDKAVAIVNPVAPCQSHNYGRISCSPVRDSGNQPKAVQTAVNCHGLIEEFPLPFSGDSRESLLLRATLKNRVENHRPFSPSPVIDNDVCLLGSSESSSDLKSLEKCDATPISAFKSPMVSHGQNLVERATESTSVSNVGLSPHDVTNCLTDSNHCNGSIAVTSIGASSCFTPPSDVLLDGNGRSGSQTPASVNESERVKMDLTKLDETIDYVLSYARSDDACEGMFVLPCRSRDPTQFSSPNLRANTPSSGMPASPSSSPPPSSPPSYRIVSSPMLNQCKAQSLVQSSNVPCVVSQSVPRFIVDQASGVVHFPRSVNPSGATQGVTQPTVSFVHVYSDSSTIPEARIPEQSGCQTKSLNPATQMVLHSNVIHGFQNHVVTPQNAFAVPPSSVPRTFNSLMSPTKVNLVHALPAHVSRVGTLSPTYTSLAHPSEPPGLVSNRTVLFSPSNTVCVMQNPLLSPPVYETPSNFPTDNQAALTYTSFQSVEKRVCPTSSPMSFRQPVAPQQSVITLSGQCGTIPVITEKDNLVTANPPNSHVRSVSGVKKRSHNSSSSATKRRRTGVPSTATNGTVPFTHSKMQSEPIQTGKSSIQECLEKLRGYDVKTLVSAPTLKPHSSVLLPAGGSDPPAHPLSDLDELELLRRRGLKYCRGPLAVQVPKLPYHKVDAETDSYIIQHLKTNAPLGPLVSPRKSQKPVGCSHPVCPSPEPPSFENHMRALFSSMHRSPKFDEEQRPPVQCVPTKSLDRVLLNPKLLPVFSEVSMGKQDAERCTPPLPLFHMPNPRLICQPICLGTRDRDVNGPISENNVNDSSGAQDSKVTGVHLTPSVQPESEYNGISVGNSPLIDSETGEVVAGRHLPQSEQVPSDPGAEKLHITFTINPSMTNSVSKIVRRIAELLDIDQSAVCYQVTRSGAQITLDQKQSQSESVMKNLESQLREHFTPLSLHVEKTTNACDDMSTLHVLPESEVFPPTVTSVAKLGSSEPSNSANSKDGSSSKLSELSRYVEEPVSIPSLLTSKRSAIKPCQNCDKPVPPQAGQRKCLEEIAALSGLSSRTDLNGDFVFCSVECLVQFSRLVSNRHVVDDVGGISRLTDEINSHHSADSRLPTLACDFSASIPILLHCGLPKAGRGSKRQLATTATSSGPGCKKRSVGSGFGSFKSKRWKGSRWRAFSSHSVPQFPKVQSSRWSEENIVELLKDHPSRLHLKDVIDHRTCLLCAVSGDATEDGIGRLLPYDVDKWLHINCALWCFEVYETVGGSLNNVDTWLKKAVETSCSHCGNLGAGLPCYNPRCTSIYHVPCAVQLKCMFFTDRGMYCPQHQPKEQHPMQLLSLAVNRRVYIARDENSQVGSVIHEEDRAGVVRIGTVYLQSVGQLLPHQIESGFFHTRRYIYPVGFRSTRIYWSMRRPKSRARYVCEILESDGKPLFKITVIDRDIENEVFTHETCSGVWKCVLSKVEQLRERDKLVRLFPEHLKGEDLYGLSEPHIVRAIESLPGVEGLRDYVFHFGRMELIAEMPLAINPSGCARSEPKMQTYVKRAHVRGDRLDSVANRTTCFPGLRRSAHPALTSVSVEFSKQHQSSRSQQYRRLKTEVGSNVILGRSRIQGLGLFAARDLEPQTMVIEYIGELIRSELANKREKTYEAHNRGIYMFRLDEDTVIDATVCGGLARYINHSCQPNCYAEFLTLGDHSHIVIVTNRHIDKGEELCYDYNFDLEDRGSKIPCLCRAPNCRKWMN